MIDFPENRAPAKVKYFLAVCQMLRNFTEGNAKTLSSNAVVKLYGATLCAK